MKEVLRIKNAVFLILLLVLSVVVFPKAINKNKEASLLVIFGNNIKTEYTPFVEDGGIYISLDTIKKTIDEHIFYDNIASKVIITTKNNVAKYKLGEKIVNLNLIEQDISNEIKKINNNIYIPLNIVKDIYNIETEYNKETKTIVVDKKDMAENKILFNKTAVYSDIKTNSNILKTLNKEDNITVYLDSLKHNRWVKVKTEDSVVGYIFKNASTLNELKEDILEIEKKDKVVMFWQYGNSLNTLGDSKIDVVGVVSPTLYELKNPKGEIASKPSKEYISKAKALGYKVWPIITNGIDSVNYSPHDTSLLMNSENARENLIKNIINIIKTDNLDGINIDFENMKSEDKDMYTQFIRELAPFVRNMGKVISVDMYFVNYVDRKNVGEAVDYVMLMGYDQRGNWSNESGSISEISWVEKNVKSLINDSNIPADKIILGVPFYTRLWTEKLGTSKPTTSVYTIKDAASYIYSNNLKPVYDEKSGQNFIQHQKGSLTYKMWIEDSTSMKNRVEIINRYNLAGLAAWQKGFETPDTWQTIKQNLNK